MNVNNQGAPKGYHCGHTIDKHLRELFYATAAYAAM